MKIIQTNTCSSYTKKEKQQKSSFLLFLVRKQKHNGWTKQDSSSMLSAAGKNRMQIAYNVHDTNIK